MDEYWGMTNETGLRTVDVYIAKLRKQFADCDSFEIVTVHGFGYKAVLNEAKKQERKKRRVAAPLFRGRSSSRSSGSCCC